VIATLKRRGNYNHITFSVKNIMLLCIKFAELL